jgi:DNA processing protein
MELSAQEKSYIWLDSFPLEEGEKRKLLHACGSAVELVKNFSSTKELFVAFSKLDIFEKMLKTLKGDNGYFNELLTELKANSTTAITIVSELYPKEWKELSDAPLVLYAKGNLELLKTEKFCIVGSRRTPQTALKTGEKIAQELSEKFTILTGVADGGDTAAIEGALKGTKKLICLHAGGYASLPKGNYALMRKVEEEGLLLCPNYFSVPVRAFSYERRNKLLALLSSATLVIGAGEKSGSLITAKYAKNYQKPIFALPYPPLSSAGVGCNALIKGGAKLTEEAKDVLDYFGLEITKRKAVDLTETEQKVWQYLADREEAHLTELAQAVGLPPFKVVSVLSALEMKGLVVKLGSNRFAPV